MIHPNTELRFISDDVGLGVVATQFIPKGTIVYVYDSFNLILPLSKIKKLDPLYLLVLDKYCYCDEKGNYVLEWDIARYMNHSFIPNCIPTAYEFDLAVRDISPGEELTEDYAFLNLKEEEPFTPIPEAGASRTRLLPGDLLKYYQGWDTQLVEAFKHFNKVDQPLSKFISRRYRRRVKSVADGKREMDSILNISDVYDKSIARFTRLRDKYRRR